MHVAAEALGAIGDGRKVLYVFEDGDAGNSEARILLGLIAADPDLADEYRRDGDMFVPKGHNGALGAADFLAWEWQNHYKSPEGAGPFPTLIRVMENRRVRYFRRGFSRSMIFAHDLANRAHGLLVRHPHG